MEISTNDFEINLEGFDKERIMKEINNNIEKTNYKIDEIIEKFDISIKNNTDDDIEEKLLSLYYLWNMNLEKPILSTSGLIGKLKIFLKKVVRKVVRPYVKPIFEEQIVFNGNVVEVLDYYNKKIEMLEKEIEVLRNNKK